MARDLQTVITDITESLKEALADNLYSCCLYGSAVRGNRIEGVSDLNFLIVLSTSTPAAHEAITHVVNKHPQLDPFVLSKRSFLRNVQAFAAKFASIKRNYRVLQGADPLADIVIDAGLERFLCEQAIRNLRLRLVYAYVTRNRSRAYDKFLSKSVTPLFTHFAEVLRLHGVEIPKDFASRVVVFEKELKIDASVMGALLAYKASPQKLSPKEMTEWHERLFVQVDTVLIWIETHWQPIAIKGP